MSTASSTPTADATESNMVVAFIQFLREKTSVQRSPDIVQTIEVAIGCLENAFGLNDANYAFQPSMPLLETFKAAENKEQDEAKNTSAETANITAANGLKEEGNELMKNGNYAEAVEKYSKAIRLHKDPVYFCNRAAAYCRAENHTLAIQDCRTALTLDPNYSKAYGRMGLALSSVHRYGEAVEAYKKAIELDPQQESYKNNLKIAEDMLRESARGNVAQEGNFPNMFGEGADMNNFAEMMRSPQMMEMASTLMNNPNVQNMMNQMMTGEGGPFGNFLQMGQEFAAQMQNTNPDFVEQLRRQFERHGSDGDDQNPPRND